MTKINSVLGPIDSKDLGNALMHEHIVSAPAGTVQNNPGLLGPRYMDRIVEGLSEARKSGISTVVDATTYDLGREANLLAEASRRSGVNIIACTGWWLNDPDACHPGWSTKQYMGLFTSEIEEGIEGTGIKAGILKSAADREGVTPAIEKTLRAVARAQLKTGVPVMLHSAPRQETARKQLGILSEEGVDLRRVKVDHSLDTTDVKYLDWILEQGCYLGVDRLPGLEMDIKDQAKTAKALIDAGWSQRLLFSHDAGLAVYMPDLPPEIRAFIEKASQTNKFLYLKNVFFPMLQDMGVHRELLERICLDNPRNFFEGP
jgi:phosphotriesterase-related protein